MYLFSYRDEASFFMNQAKCQGVELEVTCSYETSKVER